MRPIQRLNRLAGPVTGRHTALPSQSTARRYSGGSSAASGLAGLSAADIFEAQGKSGQIDPCVAPLWRPMSLAGPAFTVRQPSGDNLALHHALSEATPGSVLVVQVEGSQPLERALMGDIIAYAAQKKKLAGLITNGAVRDWDKLYELNFSVYCCGRPLTP